MTSIESVRIAISKHFQHVVDLGDGVMRGELLHKDKPYAVAYVDLSDAIVERSRDLTSFQESLLGAEFFSPDSDLRWNSYLYFLAGPKSVANDQFLTAKARIEGDRHFARKFVLEPGDLVLRLREPGEGESPQPLRLLDAAAEWAQVLKMASLGSLLEQPARRTALDEIASGQAFKAEVATPASSPVLKPDPLAKGVLRTLKVELFRPVIDGKAFVFGDVNLVVGANGSGKTSLLEAIEALYCGRVRRDPGASLFNIEGTLDNGNGALKTVRATTTVSVLKARNTLWYGRADFQSHAITQGFSRFNFLDSDAAFRLSSDADHEDIKEDLGKLLVGSETSKLWDYLSKLYDDVRARLRSLSDRLPDQRRKVELLEAEVKRLREAPSEASTLLVAYRDSLARLAPKWAVEADSAALIVGERERLGDLVEATRLVQSAFSKTPVTREKIEQRMARLREAVTSVKALHEKYDASLKGGNEAQARLNSKEAQKAHLGQWLRLLEAGVPALATGLREAEQRTATLRVVLRDQPGETLHPVPAEYAALSVSDARELSDQKVSGFEEQEKAAELALSHSLQLGQSLEALRRDLRDSAFTYMERSGEANRCPVCKTAHPPADLLAKLEALVGPPSAGATESLRRNAQLAREQTVRCRHDVDLLVALAKYADASGAAATTTCGELQDNLRKAIADLSEASAEMQTRRDALNQLDLQGLAWRGWERTRDSIIAPLLPSDADPASEVAIKGVLSALDEQISREAQAATNEREAAATLAQQITDQVSKELDDRLANVGHLQQITALERTLGQMEGALQEIDGLGRLVHLPPNSSVEELQTQLEACLLAFDRAHHAFQADVQAKATLGQKTDELNSATESLASDTTRQGNLSRASEALSQVVEQHSLERATADAFGAIKNEVSAIFAQIHSPQEYELGDFTNDSLIIRRDNRQVHAVNQVSTGQRAALALSIFLALNDSAESAPPLILIDDPVAHIDDLNALSFLDYLRELVLHSRKQVFFATADIRLAALFQRKFEFLGDHRFKRLSLPLRAEAK